MFKKKLISIGVPCFNEEDNILFTYRILKKTINKINKYDFETIFIDNGSEDNTRALINKIAGKDKFI